MYRKMFSLIVMLVIMVATVPPVKVKAQGLEEKALILAVASMGPGETLDFTWVWRTRHGVEQPPIFRPGDSATFTIVVTNTGDASCRQAIQAEVAVHRDLNTLTLAKKGAKLFINGEESEDILIPCVSDALRNAFLVGVPVSQNMGEQIAADPTAANGLGLQEVWGYTISGAGGETRASTSLIVFGNPSIGTPLR